MGPGKVLLFGTHSHEGPVAIGIPGCQAGEPASNPNSKRNVGEVTIMPNRFNLFQSSEFQRSGFSKTVLMSHNFLICSYNDAKCTTDLMCMSFSKHLREINLSNRGGGAEALADHAL